MISDLLVANSVLLLLFVSMYLGTGWSLVLFSFPVARELTVDNYYLVFVPQVERATRFFTVMTQLMILSALIMILDEWRTGYAWVPVVVLALVIASAVLTVKWIFPYNKRMREGITDQGTLKETLRRWMFLTWIRTSIWTLQWLAMATYFVLSTG